ncbi:MAG: AAA family ATPase [Nitrososphaerales archaeon]
MTQRKHTGRRSKLSVIISGMTSVGKTTAANVIAKEFRLTHYAGGDMLKQMAIERGYKPAGSDWWDTPEGMRFLSERSANSDFDTEVDRRLVEKIKRGGVVVTSYPIPWICKEGFKLWFKASQKTRAKRLAGRDAIPLSSALKIIRRRDTDNRKLYQKLYGIEFGRDLSVFNFEIDTNNISANEVARFSAELVRDYERARDFYAKKSDFCPDELSFAKQL